MYHSTGDTFEIENSFYLLINQTCDMSIRKIGSVSGVRQAVTGKWYRIVDSPLDKSCMPLELFNG